MYKLRPRLTPIALMALIFVIISVSLSGFIFNQESGQLLCPSFPGWSELSLPWQRTDEPNPSMRALAVAPGLLDSRKIYLGTSRGLYISEDCGSKWHEIAREEFLHSDAAYIDGVQVDDSGFIYVARRRHPMLIINEFDLSASQPFLSLTSGESRGYVMTSYAKIFHDGTRSYAGLERLGDRSIGGWVLGEDHGRRWTLITGQYPVGFFDVDSQDPAVLYVAYKSQVTKSVDSGVTFTRLAELTTSHTEQVGESNAAGDEEDPARDLSVGGHTGTGWIVTRGHALYRSQGDLTSWRKASVLPVVNYESGLDRVRVAASETDPDVAFVVSRDSRLWVYRDPAAAQ